MILLDAFTKAVPCLQSSISATSCTTITLYSWVATMGRKQTRKQEIYSLKAKSPQSRTCQQCGELKLDDRQQPISRRKRDALRVIPRWFTYVLLAKGIAISGSSQRVCHDCYDNLDISKFHARCVYSRRACCVFHYTMIFQHNFSYTVW